MTGRQTERPDATWQPARLISAVGIKGDVEQEQRAVSSLLAVMVAVPDFGREIVSRLGAPAGRMSTYIEVRFPNEEGPTLRPDGAIVVERGAKRWTFLVEVKTGVNEVRAEQVETYIDLARAHGFDGVLTISNQIMSGSDELPFRMDPRKLRHAKVRHMSWWRILTMAVVQKEHRGISDPEQGWILGELIRYLQDDRSGASGFEDMGDKWVTVRDGIRDQTLKASDRSVQEIAERWEQFIEYISLELRQTLGRPVSAIWPRMTDREARVLAASKLLVQDGLLSAALKVPDTAAPIDVEANLRTRQLVASTEIAAPRDGRAKGRIGWLLRQAKEMPPSLRVEVRYPNAREPTAARLTEALERPERLLYSPDPKRDPRSFRLVLADELGRKRGRGPGTFVGDSRKQLLDFYRDVLQRIRPWQPPAPRLPDKAEGAPVEEQVPVGVTVPQGPAAEET
ncbi:hypothetical protein BH24CHL6_BH24CHL6_15420 [soil metagenome]